MSRRLWPDMAELEARRSECLAQISSRRAILEGRWLRHDGDVFPFDTFQAADVVLANLQARLATYHVDIERMSEHEITALRPSDVGGKVWACKCGATGTAPTAFTAMARWTEHVEHAVWGVEP